MRNKRVGFNLLSGARIIKFCVCINKGKLENLLVCKKGYIDGSFVKWWYVHGAKVENNKARMADLQRNGVVDRDINQAITTLKKGTSLLKYGRRGKPKFCPFKLSNDESKLIWYSRRKEKHIRLSHVSRIIPGQRTAVFQRYPQPEKEYQSFSLILNDRSLDLICKDKKEAEVWLFGLKALVSHGINRKWRVEAGSDTTVSGDSPELHNKKSPPNPHFDRGDAQGIQAPSEPGNRLGKTFADIVTHAASIKVTSKPDLVEFGLIAASCVENINNRSSGADVVRVSSSSSVSSLSHGSCKEDVDALVDIFIWGQGVGEGILGGGEDKVESSFNTKIDALLPKAMESTTVLDVHGIACGSSHAVIVTKQGEIFSWGEESGGRLGHGADADVPQPKLMDTLRGMNFQSAACGEYHTCAVTVSGDLYTWGDGAHSSGLLGHGSDVSHWIPRRVSDMDGMHVSYVSCGPWHTALLTSGGELFTFGDGYFGALGHGDRSSTTVLRKVETLSRLRTTRVSCGSWHTAAVVVTESSDDGCPDSSSSTKLFTWGDGDKGELGHGNREPRLSPQSVDALFDVNISQVACGQNLTVTLSTSGQVYTMGSSAYGQLGSRTVDGKVPTRVGGKIAGRFVEEIACGSHHVAVVTSKKEVYTWGKGTNGQLGHGNTDDRETPTRVDFLKDKQVKSVVCGSNFTAVLSLHKWAQNGNIPRKFDESIDKEVLALRSHAQLSRLSSLGSSSQAESRLSRSELKLDFENRTIFPAQTGNFHLGGFNTPRLPIYPVGDSRKSLPPISRRTSRATSPASGKSSNRSSTVTIDDSKQMNDNANQEIINLRAQDEMISFLQVEALTCKSRQLEAELEKTSRRLQEVTARAETEAGKYKSAEEIIMSLTDKLEQVTDMLPPGQKGLLYNAGPIAKHTTVEHVFANATNMMCTM
ncbi:Regulator of chromosome condensation (RCC1) family with FYVE zinc finger domain [Hibiscus syriacus]|uniref:Regulator of chromosome condensation (RCC1) family with FYVE zinc finger domain n=1 Tax=Hibiscus syriacus TaxID=106335 RepID=A0A6A2Y433_HIBSY|nr:Regulator of chromosome condensation (RCC1) family with FYVE zinc finger domain [Hibiscus syriacus]